MKLKNGECDLVQMDSLKPGVKLHNMWKTFKVVREKGVLHPAVQCSRCTRILTYKQKQNGNRNLSRHLESCLRDVRTSQDKLDPPAAAKRQFCDVAAKWVALGLRAPEQFSDPATVLLIQKCLDLGFMYAGYGRLDAEKLIPHPSTVAEEVKTQAKAARAETVKEVEPLLRAYKCSATADCWTDEHSQDHYAVLTTHFMKQWDLNDRLLFARPLPPNLPCTGENLRAFMRQCLGEMGFDPSLMERMKFTTDNGGDIKKALEMIIRFYCVTHALNIVLRTTLSVKYATVLEVAIASHPKAETIITKGNEWIKEVRAALPKGHRLLGKGILKASNFLTQGHLTMLRNCCDFQREVGTWYNTTYIALLVERKRGGRLLLTSFSRHVEDGEGLGTAGVMDPDRVVQFACV